MIKDKNGIEIKVGDKVKHFSRTDGDGNDLPGYRGVVISLDPNRFPLVEVECGTEFPRLLPNMDLVHIKEGESE